MPKRKPARKIPIPEWQRHRGAVAEQLASRSSQFYLTAGVFLLVIAAVAIVGYAIVSGYIRDQQRPGSTAVKVGERNYTVRYYSNLLKEYVESFGVELNDPQIISFALTGLSEQIIQEALLLELADDEGLTLTDDEMNEKIATDLAIAKDDPNFAARVQAEAVRLGVSEEQYKDRFRSQVYLDKLKEKFKTELPATAESVHYRQIQVANQAEADEIRSLIVGGGDFAQLAMERSQDTTSKETGGDMGWIPRGYLGDTAQEDLLFGLEPDELTTYPTQSGAFVLQLLEKQADRPIDEDKSTALVDRRYREWLDEKRGQLSIVNHMDPQNGDEDKIRYAVDQITEGVT